MLPADEPLPDFFRVGSPFFKHPLLTQERTESEVDFIENELRLTVGERILDVGCGFGRHSIELARRGYAVTGIDPSGAMIAAARQRAQEEGLEIDFRQERGQHMRSASPFAAALCLFTTLGQIDEQGENTALINNVHSMLQDGGHLLVEVPQRGTAVRRLTPYEEIGQGPRKAFVRRRYDAQSRSIFEEFRIVSGHDEQTYRLRYRLFTRYELESLLTNAGFSVTAVYSDYEGTELGPEQAQMLVLARK